jgi:hypothetical protein
LRVLLVIILSALLISSALAQFTSLDGGLFVQQTTKVDGNSQAINDTLVIDVSGLRSYYLGLRLGAEYRVGDKTFLFSRYSTLINYANLFTVVSALPNSNVGVGYGTQEHLHAFSSGLIREVWIFKPYIGASLRFHYAQRKQLSSYRTSPVAEKIRDNARLITGSVLYGVSTDVFKRLVLDIFFERTISRRYNEMTLYGQPLGLTKFENFFGVSLAYKFLLFE